MMGLTEADMIRLLEDRYRKTDRAGSRRFEGAPHVRLMQGYGYAGRIADYVAIDTWASSGFPVHGHEVKVSRSDWLRELKDPSKAEAIAQHCDFWWLVVSHMRVVEHSSLVPDGWGLMVADGRGGLRVARQAVQRPTDGLPRGLVAGLVRAVAQKGRGSR